jgi:hypothetical protein
MSGQLVSARASSVAAAYHRLANDYVNRLVQSVVNEESDPDDSGFNTHEKPASIDLIEKENLDIQYPNEAQKKPRWSWWISPLIVSIGFSMSFVDWVFIGLLIIVVEIEFMVDCRVADLGEFDASPVT